MINITFKISNKDYSDKLSTFKCLQSPSNVKIITTLDGTDKQFIGKLKSEITVSFLPLTKAQLFELYELVKEYSFLVTYTNPYIEDDVILVDVRSVLNEQQRTVFEYLLLGYTQCEIAKILNISQPVISRKITKIRQIIKKELCLE